MKLPRSRLSDSRRSTITAFAAILLALHAYAVANGWLEVSPGSGGVTIVIDKS